MENRKKFYFIIKIFFLLVLSIFKCVNTEEAVEKKNVQPFKITIDKGTEWKKGSEAIVKWSYPDTKEVTGYVNVRLYKMVDNQKVDTGIYGQPLTASKKFKFQIKEDAKEGDVYYVIVSSQWRDYEIGESDSAGTASNAFVILKGKVSFDEEKVNKEKSKQNNDEEENSTSECSTSTSSESTTSESTTTASKVGVVSLSRLAAFFCSFIFLLIIC